MRLLLSLLLSLSLLSTYLVNVSNADPVPAPRYVVNLDLPAQDRWNHVIVNYKSDLQGLVKELKKMVSPEVLALASLLGDSVEKYIPYPYNLEMVGVAVTGGVTVGETLLGNLLYEVTAYNSSKLAQKACTSIVAEALNGTMYHGRNLDYSFTELLRNSTIIVDFQSNGKTLYTGKVELELWNRNGTIRERGYRARQSEAKHC